ncbi:hypothetical protein V1520DRAFT_327545 [Lipomyces starkeyi]
MHGPRRWESWNRSAENKRASRLASHEGVDVAKFWGPNPDCVPCELVYLPLRPPGKPSALDGICMRIKGNKQAKKEDVVVAYGAGQFGSTMNGKKLLRLRSCASVFGVDERRTSRVCSKQNEEQRARTDLGEEEDENGGSSSTAETGVREEDDAGSNRWGPNSYPRTTQCKRGQGTISPSTILQQVSYSLEQRCKHGSEHSVDILVNSVHSGRRLPGFRRCDIDDAGCG